MSRIAFLSRTDVHAADKSPTSWRGDYRAEILESLRQIGNLATAHGVRAVLDAGDFIHVKTASRTSHGLVSSVIKLHTNEYQGIPVYTIEGNHDIVGNNLESVEEQPLGVLLESGTFRPLREEVFEEGNLRVRVVGIPFDPHLNMETIQKVKKQAGDDYLVMVIHALAGENPPAHVEEFFKEPVFRYSQFVYEGGPDVVCFGHWHKDQGIVNLDGRSFVNVGAVSRGALNHDNLSRIPKVAILEFSKESFRTWAIPLEVAAAEEVYDLERKEREEKASLVVTQFVQTLQNNINVKEGEDIEYLVAHQNGVESRIIEKTLHYISRAKEA